MILLLLYNDLDDVTLTAKVLVVLFCIDVEALVVFVSLNF